MRERGDSSGSVDGEDDSWYVPGSQDHGRWSDGRRDHGNYRGMGYGGRRGVHNRRYTQPDDLTVGVWNVNGWTNMNLDYDIFCIVEKQFVNEQCRIDIPKHSWFYHNRQAKSRRAVKGSVGVAVHVKGTIIQQYSVNVDKAYDEILGLRLPHRVSGFAMIVYACYLPPENSVWGRNPDGF